MREAIQTNEEPRRKPIMREEVKASIFFFYLLAD
jgi:hypothetical protein